MDFIPTEKLHPLNKAAMYLGNTVTSTIHLYGTAGIYVPCMCGSFAKWLAHINTCEYVLCACVLVWDGCKATRTLLNSVRASLQSGSYFKASPKWRLAKSWSGQGQRRLQQGRRMILRATQK